MPLLRGVGSEGTPPAPTAPASTQHLPLWLPVELAALVASPAPAEDRPSKGAAPRPGTDLPTIPPRPQHHEGPALSSFPKHPDASDPPGPYPGDTCPGDISPSQIVSTCPAPAGSCPPAFPGLPRAPVQSAQGQPSARGLCTPCLPSLRGAQRQWLTLPGGSGLSVWPWAPRGHTAAGRQATLRLCPLGWVSGEECSRRMSSSHNSCSLSTLMSS